MLFAPIITAARRREPFKHLRIDVTLLAYPRYVGFIYFIFQNMRYCEKVVNYKAAYNRRSPIIFLYGCMVV